MIDLAHRLLRAIGEDDLPTAGALLEQAQTNISGILNPVPCGMPPVAAARSLAMADLLLGHGADLGHVSAWWESGFGTHAVSTEVAAYLAMRGASVSVHAAAGLGLAEILTSMLDADASLLHARGGDGCTPLHFARTVDVAHLLIARGADLNARDEDHRSTPAQWRIGEAPEITRLLLEHGATADIFMGAGLGDLALTQQLVSRDPTCTTFRIGNNRGPFPGIGFEDRGGTIYQWTLGFNRAPHEIAMARGHLDVYLYLIAHTPPRQLLLVACMLADRALAQSIVADHPHVLGQLDEEDHALLAKSCWETNLNIDAVRLMLDLGFPVDAPEFNHGYTALHNAAWCGDRELVHLLLLHGHPPDIRDPVHNSTPVGFALYSCLQARRHPEGDFAGVIDLLLTAGVPFEKDRYPVGHAAIDGVLKEHLGL